MSEKICVDDLSSLGPKLISEHRSFVICGAQDTSNVASKVESMVEKAGYKCRVYTANRTAVAGGASLLTGFGLAALAGIAFHNLATWDPDYEICKHPVDDTVEVNWKH